MKIIGSFRFAIKGIKHCFLTQINFRIHLLLALVAILVGIGFHISANEWMFIIFSISLVLLTEMMNTSIEKLCDFIHTDRHPQVEIIKDIAAGAVLISALASLIAGLIIFLPKIIFYIHSF